MFVRPINFTALHNVSLDLLWQVGVPTHTAHVLPWRRAAGLADGSRFDDWKASGFVGGDDEEDHPIVAEEVGSRKRVRKVKLMDGYGPRPVSGDTCLVQYAAWPSMATGPEDVISCALESPLRVLLSSEEEMGGRCIGIELLDDDKGGGAWDGGVPGGDGESALRAFEEAICACLPTIKIGELVNVTHDSGGWH